MKIIAVGMNYADHVKELDGSFVRPEEPVIFLKPDSALLKDGKPFFIPDFSQEVHYEAELVVRICRLGKNIAERFAHRYYDAVTVGIDFTARDLQRKFRSVGDPWDMVFKIDEVIAYVSRFFTLKIGDLLYTGTPVGVGPVHVDEHLQGYLEDEKLLDFYIR